MIDTNTPPDLGSRFYIGIELDYTTSTLALGEIREKSAPANPN